MLNLESLMNCTLSCSPWIIREVFYYYVMNITTNSLARLLSAGSYRVLPYFFKKINSSYLMRRNVFAPISCSIPQWFHLHTMTPRELIMAMLFGSLSTCNICY